MAFAHSDSILHGRRNLLEFDTSESCGSDRARSVASVHVMGFASTEETHDIEDPVPQTPLSRTHKEKTTIRDILAHRVFILWSELLFKESESSKFLGAL